MGKAALAVARLDPLKMVKESGIIPERINFAIPSSTLRTRLTRASIAFTFAQPTRPITDISLAATKARHFDVLGIVSTKYDAEKDVGSVTIRYTYEISNRAKRKMGEAESLLVFENVSKEPRVILVKEQMTPKH
jgi:hypothetical protein